MAKIKPSSKSATDPTTPTTTSTPKSTSGTKRKVSEVSSTTDEEVKKAKSLLLKAKTRKANETAKAKAMLSENLSADEQDNLVSSPPIKKTPLKSGDNNEGEENEENEHESEHQSDYNSLEEGEEPDEQQSGESEPESEHENEESSASDNEDEKSVSEDLSSKFNGTATSKRSKSLIVQTSKAVRLEKLSNEKIVAFREYCQTMADSSADIVRNDLISRPAQNLINIAFKAKRFCSGDEWKAWKDDIFFEKLLIVFPKASPTGVNTSSSVEAQLRKIKLGFYHVLDDESIQTFITSVYEVVGRLTPKELGTKRMKSILKILFDNLGKETKSKKALLDQMYEGGAPETIDDFNTKLYAQVIHNRDVILQAISLGFVDESKLSDPKKIEGATKPKPSSGGEQKSWGPACTGCGRTNHQLSGCYLKDHPDFNKNPNIAWKDCNEGKAWSARKMQFLPNNLTLSGVKYSSANNNSDKRPSWQKRG